MADEEIAEHQEGNYLSGIVAQIMLVAFWLLILMIGAWVAGAGFHDPDTCWLLALGKVIFEHKALPVTDPFSYTFAMPPAKAFVMYQWLTELLLYTCYRIGGLIAVLSVAALAVHCAFVALPLYTFDKLGLTRQRSFGLIALGLWAAAFHLLIRPEMFSYLLLSLWMAIFTKVRTDKSERSTVNWRYVTCFCAIMILWCNLHTGFTSGLINLAVFSLGCFVSSVAGGDTPRWKRLTTYISLASAAACSLINPKFIQLWSYIPHLYFGHFNKNIIELKPLALKDLLDPTWIPFLLLSLLAVMLWMRVFRQSAAWNADRVYSLFMIALLIVLGVSCRRLISFNAVVLMYECAWLRAQSSVCSTGFGLQVSEKLKSIFQVNPIWIVSTSTIVIIGVFLIASGPVKPRVPQPSVAFQYPGEVIDYMKSNPPSGHGFNTPHFGDVMVWNLNPCPEIFMDTRFDMYGGELVDDYYKLSQLQPGWEQLLEAYAISWVFVSPDQPLGRHIKSDSQWSIRAQGPNSLYAVRKATTKNLPNAVESTIMPN